MKLLAIDIGASGGKAAVGEFSSGALSITEVRRFPNSMIEIHGRLHWDILRLYDEVLKCIAAAPDAQSVGIDTWGVDYGYIGHDGDLMGLPFAYRDSRTEHSIPVVHDRISQEELYSITGIQFLPFNTVYQLMDDLLSRPWLVDNSKCILMMPELLGYLLTGQEFAEYSNASTTGILDVRTRKWSGEVLNRIGYPYERMPEIIDAGELKTALNDRIKSETGSKADFVAVGCHDTASAVASIPASGDNWAYISCGTWSLVGMELPEPITSDAARNVNFTNEGGVNGTIRFLTNVTGLWLLEELRRMWALNGEVVDYSTIISEAEKAPAFRSIVNPDHPSFIAPDDMRAAIRAFCRKSGQTVPNGVGPFSRCVFESLALAYRKRIAQLSEISGRKIERIHMVGGGSRNEMLCRMTADACGIPVTAGPVEATMTGNLMMQGIAHGLIGSVLEGREIVARSVKPVEYHPARIELWDNAAENFQDLLSAQTE